MAKVVGIRGATPVDPTGPNEELVVLLEELLAKAKSGELRSLAAVLSTHDEVEPEWSVEPGDMMTVHSGVMQLQEALRYEIYDSED